MKTCIKNPFPLPTLIAGLGYLNDWVFRLNHIAGNHFPISVFGGLVLFALGLNLIAGFGTS